jgi:hypothetical protein
MAGCRSRIEQPSVGAVKYAVRNRPEYNRFRETTRREKTDVREPEKNNGEYHRLSTPKRRGIFTVTFFREAS